MIIQKTIALSAALFLASLGIAFAQSGSSVPPTQHQIRHGMKPGHHGVPSTGKHHTSYKKELQRHPSAATSGNGA